MEEEEVAAAVVVVVVVLLSIGSSGWTEIRILGDEDVIGRW